ncbi:MAG: GNAT family N-acetyltransferase [Anaerolineae bacterium]|nr:GNAT family N-acetyltransferase [Anaerolineae bacterium]
MIIRPVNLDELDALLQLYQQLHPQDTPLPSKPELVALWQGIFTNPLLHYFGVELEGQLVASCTLTLIPNLTRGARPYGLIENVITHPAYRRQGLGKAVLQHALQVAWEADCYKVMLLTGSKRAEVFAFYEAAGFKRGVKTGFIAVPPEK